MKTSRICFAVFIILLLSGCGSQKSPFEKSSIYDSPPFQVRASVDQIEKMHIPDDIKAVTAAIVQQLRKDSTGIPRVDFNPSGVHLLAEDNFNYQGFAVTDNIIQDLWFMDTERNSSLRRLEGSLIFRDILGRRAFTHYFIDYELFDDNIVILNSVARPVDPIFPNTQAFIVEAADLQAIANLNPDFNRFYAEVLSRAVSMTPTSEERMIRQELEEMSFFERIRKTPSTERDYYYMIIFVMDRIMPDAGIEVVVTSSLQDKSSQAESMYRDFDGWRVAIFGGNFAIDHDVFYAKTYYRPGPGVLPDNKDQVLVGLFATEKNYETQQRQTQVAARPVTQQASYTPAEEHMALGRSSLNTSNRNDARVIQTRLAELGFYNMAIDGLWGQGSRTALQNFQRTKGLTASGEWNTQTQMILFPLKISSRDDAAVIQTRLAELGFYNMTVDGLWGQGSRTALQNFQRANGLAASGEWNIQTQMILFPGTGK
jgi:peptidoglycan hydrolase-like protein with peptidoglycan-binding domain